MSPASQENERFRLIFEQALDPMVLIDRVGRILEANLSACRTLGYSHGELVGHMLITDLDQEATQADVDRVHGDPDSYLPASFQTVYRRRDGTSFPADVHLNAVWLEDTAQVFATFRDISRRLADEERLRESERQLRSAVMGAPMVLFSLDEHGVFTLSEGRGLSALGLEPGQVVGKNALDMYRDHPEIVDGIKRALAGEPVEQESHVQGRYYENHWQPILDPEDRPRGVLGVSYDITGQRTAEQDLTRQRDRLLTTLQSIADGVITTDVEGCVDYMNPVAETLTGFRHHQAQGRPLDEILKVEDPETGSPLPNPVERCLYRGSALVFNEESRMRGADGEIYTVRLTASPLRQGDERIIGAVLVLHDFSLLWDMARQLSHQATHDALTDLINRREFERRLEEALEDARLTDRTHALCYMDLDQFKIVNDTCGHKAGDELLKQLAAILPGHIRANDTLARLGGDEFGLLLTGCPLPRAEFICREILEEVRGHRFMWDDRRFDVGMSIGLVPIDAQSPSLSDLMSRADSACYMAKEQGRNRTYVTRPDDEALNLRFGEMEWVSRIRSAIEEQRFVLYVQPILPVTGSRDVSHYEVLLRLRGDDDTMIEPGTFIPAAERYHLMPEVDRYVIDALFSILARHPQALSGAMVAINLSGQSLGHEYMLEFVTHALQSYGLPADRICFEITETAAIANFTAASGFIREMRAMGCAFALDDFGSGLSSFSYLKQMPVDFLKIDGSFVRDILDDPVDAAMVSAIHQVGRVLGIRTIAEFVETDVILNSLRDIGVDYAQGYGVGRPVPLEQSGLFD
jgi:diguanylate cyclase (GGDEF)-like protein/PAS domain S-box-containing protein